MKNQKGITLIALIITIIVMLILVGVSVTVALNGGLFSTAQQATEETATKRNEELELSSGKVEINGEEYNSIDEYVNGSGTTQYTAYSIGDEVTVGGEYFYVLKDSGSSESTVTLLAKDCIVVDESSEDYLKQSASAGIVAFSSTNYWSSETEYPLDLTDYPIPEGVTTPALTAAKEYGVKVGGRGRLITYEEAITLETANSDILYGRNGKSSKNFLDYWTGTAGNSNGPHFVFGGNSMVYGCNYNSGPRLRSAPSCRNIKS